MLKRSIHMNFSTNCMFAEVVSNPVINGTVTSKPKMEPINATQRTPRAQLSLPKASRRTPKMMGVQMARLNKPIFVLPYLLSHTK